MLFNKVIKVNTVRQNIKEGGVYHIYNRGNNKENIFLDSSDYTYFLNLVNKYIKPISTIYSWALLKNHFHLVLRIKENRRYKYTKKTLPSADYNIWETEEIIGKNDGRKSPNPSNHFKHCFNAYATYFNTKYRRTGSLFTKPFRRVSIEDESQLINEILYVNYNPVKHGFSDDVYSWKWTSVKEIVYNSKGLVDGKFVISLFNDVENFKQLLKSRSDNISSSVD